MMQGPSYSARILTWIRESDIIHMMELSEPSDRSLRSTFSMLEDHGEACSFKTEGLAR